MFVHPLHSRLDKVNDAKWEEFRKGDDNPPLSKMIEFLEKQTAALQSTGLVNDSLSRTVHNEYALQRPGSKPGAYSSGAGAAAAPREWCVKCNIFGHKIFTCPKFLPLCVAERWEMVRALNLCPNCLKTGHGLAACWDTHRCTMDECADDNGHNTCFANGR